MLLVFSIFSDYPDLAYGFSEKSGGSMRGRHGRENRERYFLKMNIDQNDVPRAGLVHGAHATSVFGTASGSIIADADGLITASPHRYLSATAADCSPVYYYDPEKNVVAIAHARWRWVLEGIVKNTLGRMVADFGTHAEDVRVGVGHGIRSCHFEVNPEERVQFERHDGFVLSKKGNIFVDLPGIIKQQLEESGLEKGRIEDSTVCTYCEEETYFSYHRDNPVDLQTMVGYIGRAK